MNAVPRLQHMTGKYRGKKGRAKELVETGPKVEPHEDSGIAPAAVSKSTTSRRKSPVKEADSRLRLVVCSPRSCSPPSGPTMRHAPLPAF